MNFNSIKAAINIRNYQVILWSALFRARPMPEVLRKGLSGKYPRTIESRPALRALLFRDNPNILPVNDQPMTIRPRTAGKGVDVKVIPDDWQYGTETRVLVPCDESELIIELDSIEKRVCEEWIKPDGSVDLFALSQRATTIAHKPQYEGRLFTTGSLDAIDYTPPSAESNAKVSAIMAGVISKLSLPTGAACEREPEVLTPEEIADREAAIQEASEGKLDYLLEGTQWDTKRQ